MKTPAKNKPAEYRGLRGARLKYISDENLAKVQGGARATPQDPARKKPDNSTDANNAGVLHDAAAAAAQADTGQPPAGQSGAGNPPTAQPGALQPQAATAHVDAADTDNQDDRYLANVNMTPNAVALPKLGAADAAHDAADAVHATDGAPGSPASADGHSQADATGFHMDPASADPVPGQTYADLRDKTVQALEAAKQSFADEVAAYVNRRDGTDSLHTVEDREGDGTQPPVPAHDAAQDTYGDAAHPADAAPANDLSDWMMVIPQQELSESQYRTLESAHQTIDAIRALQQGLHDLQEQETLGKIDPALTGHDASNSPQGPEGHAAAPVDDAFGKALAAQAALFESKVDNLISTLQRNTPVDPGEVDAPTGHEAGSEPTTHPTPEAHDDWVVIDQPFAVSMQEYEAAKGVHEDLRQMTAQNVETFKAQLQDALQDLTAQVDEVDRTLAARDTAGHDVATEHPAAQDPDATQPHEDHEAPVVVTDEDSQHVVDHLPDNSDTHHAAPDSAASGSADDAMMAMIKDRLPHLQDGKMVVPDAPKDDPANPNAVEDAMEASLLKALGDDADLMASDDGSSFVTVKETHDPAAHDAGAQGIATHDAPHADTPGPDDASPLTVHDAAASTTHAATTAPDSMSFDQNARSADVAGIGKVQEQVLKPNADGDAPVLDFDNAYVLPEEDSTRTPAEHAAPETPEVAHATGEEHSANSAGHDTPAHPVQDEASAHHDEETHPVAEEDVGHASAEHDPAHPQAADEHATHATAEEHATDGTESNDAPRSHTTDSEPAPRTSKEVIDDAYNVIDQRQSPVRTGDQIGHVTSGLVDGEKTGVHTGADTSSSSGVFVNADGVTYREDQYAQAEAGATYTKGPISIEADAKASAHDSGAVHIGKGGIDVTGQAGVDASASVGVSARGDLGHGVKGTVGVEDTAEAHAAVAGRIGTQGVELAAAAGVTNTTSAGAGLTADLGKGVSMTNEVHAGMVEQATAAAHGGISDQGVGMGTATSAGTYATIGGSVTVGDDHYSGTAGGDLHSPGAIGFAEDASATFDDGKVTFNLAGDIDLGIGGFAFHIGATIDVSGIEHKAEHAIEDAAKHVAEVLSSAAHSVEHELVKVGYAIEDAAKVAAHAVANWFKSW